MQLPCPRLVATSEVSRAWHFTQSPTLSGGSKSCGAWQLAHGVPPPCAAVSEAAMLLWQLVQASTFVAGLAG